jgi:hypothetical protein
VICNVLVICIVGVIWSGSVICSVVMICTVGVICIVGVIWSGSVICSVVMIWSGR